jgi:hypothetical protein
MALMYQVENVDVFRFCHEVGRRFVWEDEGKG